VISEKGRTTISPSVRRFQRYMAVFVLGVVLLIHGSTLVTGDNWPRGGSLDRHRNDSIGHRVSRRAPKRARATVHASFCLDRNGIALSVALLRGLFSSEVRRACWRTQEQGPSWDTGLFRCTGLRRQLDLQEQGDKRFLVRGNRPTPCSGRAPQDGACSPLNASVSFPYASQPMR
jgi:hypothetical protein